MPKTKVHLVILSLGAGIGSSAMALMMKDGHISGFPQPDYAVFADTQSEPKHVYDTVEWLRDLLPYPIVTTSAGNLGENTWKALTGIPVPERGHVGKHVGHIDLPVFSTSGLGRRQCTGYYKISPIKAKIRELAQAAPPALTAVQYLGISADEPRRVKPSLQKWLTSQYPLYEKSITRSDCRQYLDERYPGNPVLRSACYFCPFHTNAEWLEIKEMYPELYQDALNMDQALQEHPRGPWHLKQGGLEAALSKHQRQPRLL